MERIDAEEITVTKDPIYRSWWRLKLTHAPAVSYRAIVEITPAHVTLHIVLPREPKTYDEVEAL